MAMGTIPKIMTSTPVSTPESSSDQFERALSSALDVIARCITSSEKLVKECENYKTAGAGASPFFLNIIKRIQDDTQAVVSLKKKFSQLNRSIKSGNLQQMREEFDRMMKSVDNISTEKIKMFSEVLCVTETANVKKRFLKTEKELTEMDETQLPDEKTKNFANMLIERNKKLIRCLDYFNILLPKLPTGPQSQQFLNVMPRGPAFDQSQLAKKLYILGESLQQRLPDEKRASLIGKVLIEDESGSSQKPSRIEDTQQQVRRLLSGFLEDSAGNLEEVRLQLTEPHGDLMNFSDTSVGVNRTLTARVEIAGKRMEKSLPVVEVELSEDQPSETSAKLIAIVENRETGHQQPVEMSLVPTSPETQIHGKIVELQQAVKSTKSRRALHQSLTEKTRTPRYNPNTTQIFEGRFKRQPNRAELVERFQQSAANYFLAKMNDSSAQGTAAEQLEYISEPAFDDTLTEVLASLNEQRDEQIAEEQLANISQPDLDVSDEQIGNISQPMLDDLMESFLTSIRDRSLEHSAEEFLANIQEPDFNVLEDSPVRLNVSRSPQSRNQSMTSPRSQNQYTTPPRRQNLSLTSPRSQNRSSTFPRSPKTPIRNVSAKQQLADISQPHLDDSEEQIGNISQPTLEDLMEELENISEPDLFHETIKNFLTEQNPNRSTDELLANISEPVYTTFEDSSRSHNASRVQQRSQNQSMPSPRNQNQYSTPPRRQNLSTTSPRSQNISSTSPKRPKSAKQVFKQIGRIVQTLAALGTDAISAEAAGG